MGKLVVSLDNVVIKEFQITKERTTLGRRPYNDIVIDNLAVSGEHAVLTAAQSDVFIEDLNSTNGTYINGKAVKKQLLSNNDVVEVGKYRIKFLAEDAEDYEKTMILRRGAFGRAPGTIGTPPPAGPPAAGPASIKGLNGGGARRGGGVPKGGATPGRPG
ncbi:MAG: FHA domain-containing protein, partial [Caulobacter sp.]|nr:FHA domain-containing protein [Vitreoscilla sp.]